MCALHIHLSIFDSYPNKFLIFFFSFIICRLSRYLIYIRVNFFHVYVYLLNYAFYEIHLRNERENSSFDQYHNYIDMIQRQSDINTYRHLLSSLFFSLSLSLLPVTYHVHTLRSVS